MIFEIIIVVKMVVFKLDYIFVMGNIIKVYMEIGIKGNLLYVIKLYYLIKFISCRVECFFFFDVLILIMFNVIVFW